MDSGVTQRLVSAVETGLIPLSFAVDIAKAESDEAQNLLTFTTKRAALNVKKALMAAVADAEQAQADTTQLVVAEARVDEAGMIKRFQPKDRGRAHPILKRLSHITISVHERDSSKGKKARR